MKPNSSIKDATRCQHHSANGRCRMPAVDSKTNLCFDHARKVLQARQDGDFAHFLTRECSGFQTAQGINHSLADLYVLLAHGHISPRRASVLAFVASLLLRSLTAIDNDPCPEANRPINFVNTAQPSVSPGGPSTVLDGSPAAPPDSPRQAPPPGDGMSSDPSPEPPAQSQEDLSTAPPAKPLPDTAQEFAAEVLNRKPL